MRTVTIDIINKNALQLLLDLELMQLIRLHKEKKNNKLLPVKSKKDIFLEELQEAVDEMKLIRAGKKKARNAKEFLSEL